MISPVILILLFVAWAILMVPWVAGAVIARRASGRWKWPETRLAFLAFASVPIMALAPAAVFPLSIRFDVGIFGIDVFVWWPVLAAAAHAAAIVLIAFAMYRLAARAADNRTA